MNRARVSGEGNCILVIVADIEFARVSQCTYVMITGRATGVTAVPAGWEESLSGRHTHVIQEGKYILC